MSGVGKSTWSSKLEKEKGFKRYCCDDLIEKGLSPELEKLGYSGINDVGRWMGQPYDERYKKNSQKYLELEAEALKNMLQEIKRLAKDKNIAVDTTGSVIYLPSDILDDLKRQTKIVYLEMLESVSVAEEMVKRYLYDQKPIIWGDVFKPFRGEKNMQTLKRCYPELLKYRKKLYEKLADIKIDYYGQMNKNFTADNLLKLIN